MSSLTAMTKAVFVDSFGSVKDSLKESGVAGVCAAHIDAVSGLSPCPTGRPASTILTGVDPAFGSGLDIGLTAPQVYLLAPGTVCAAPFQADSGRARVKGAIACSSPGASVAYGSVSGHDAESHTQGPSVCAD